MRIQSSDITFQSQHRARQSSRSVTRREPLQLATRMAGPPLTSSQSGEKITLSAEGKSLAQQAQQKAQANQASQAASEANDSGLSSSFQVLVSILKSMFGVDVKLFNARDLTSTSTTEQTSSGTTAALPAPDAATAAPSASELRALAVNAAPNTFIETTTTRYHEEEQLSWNANGVVTTADGKTVSFALDLALSRSISWDATQVRTIGPRLKDPLVINFAGTAAQLSNQRRDFDLDNDGQTENMAMLASGSGFLALDMDENGSIDNGSELFGAQSGDGFADLAQLDDDGNGWIDEGDAAFARLKLWTQNESGEDQLLSLSEVGIGALFLGSERTEFSLKDEQHKLQGQLRSTGVFLRENGTAGTMQQIDLAV